MRRRIAPGRRRPGTTPIIPSEGVDSGSRIIYFDRGQSFWHTGVMENRDVDVINKETVFEGYFTINRYRLRHRLHAGGMSEELEREVAERGDVSAVLPVDLQRRKVILIEQFRAGAFAAQSEPWLVECVAGIIEVGETAEQVARREALEEAGCRIDTLIPMQYFYTTPGALTETVHLFCGITDSRGVGGIHGAAEEGEDIRVHVVPMDEALAMADQGRIRNAITLVALQWLSLHRSDLPDRVHSSGVAT